MIERERIVRSPRSFRLAIALAMACALGLGSVRIGRQSLWLDELFSMAVARGSWASAWSIASGHELHSGVYHVASWPWVAVFGDSEAGLRSLSVLFGVATVPVLMLLARRLFNTRTALLVAPLFLIHAQTIHYFQEARTYTLAMLGSCVATLALTWAMDDRTSTRRWVMYGAVAGVASYTHLFVWFVLVGHGVALLALRALPSRRAFVWGATAFAAIVVPLVRYTTLGQSNLDWVPSTTVRAVRSAVADIVMGGGREVWLLLVLAVWAMVIVRVRDDRSQLAGVMIALSWVVLPFVLAIGASVFKPVFVSYYLNVCVPAVALLTAAGVDTLATRSRALAAGGLLFLLLQDGRLLADWYRGVPAKDDYRAAVAFVCASVGDDGAVTYGPDLAVAAYYQPPTCRSVTAPDRLLLVVRNFDPIPAAPGWVQRSKTSFTGVDVIAFARAPS